MTPIIHQKIRFRSSPRQLIEMYLDSRKHSLSTGAPAKVSRKPGRTFTAFGGAIGGKNIAIVPGKRIVQLWRANHWKKDDWSVLILTFTSVTRGTEVDLVHVGVPRYDHKGVTEGWPNYYWKPWKKYLAAKRLR